MAQLLVRKLHPRIVRSLKARAARQGRSAEAEHRALLERVLLGRGDAVDFKAFLRSMPAPPAFRVRRSRDRGRRVRL